MEAKETIFEFDHAFNSSYNNWSIYAKTTSHLIPGLLNGFNGTVFAYGATGAGKTYT